MEFLIVLTLYVQLVLLIVPKVSAKKDRASLEKKLYKDVPQRHNPSVHPTSRNGSDVTLVTFDVQIIRLLQMNERDQTVQVYLWVNQYWVNTQLSWNPRDYGNISKIYVDPFEVWTPDIVLYNSVAGRSAHNDEVTQMKSKIRIDHTGHHSWMNQGVITAICRIDVSYFPFDDQCCRLKEKGTLQDVDVKNQFGSWAFDASRLDMQPKFHNFGSNMYYLPNGEWQLVSMESKRHARKYQCCENAFVDITVTIKLRRFALNYSLNLIIPCCLLSSLVLMGYILPPESGERIGLMVALLLSVTVFQQLTNSIMPSYDFPFLAQYYWATIIQTGMSLVVTTIILNCYHRHHRHMHWLLRKILFDWIGPVIFCKTKNNVAEYGESNETIVTDTAHVQTEDSDGHHQNTRCCKQRSVSGSPDNECEKESNNRRPSRKLTTQSMLLSDVYGGTECILQSLLVDADRKIVLERRKKDWIKAVRILDRLFLILSFFTFVITCATIFFRAPRFWSDNVPTQCPEILHS